jgi:hypothetical protein
VPQRLPNAPESRVLLALYYKGPLNKTQLSNLEAISLQATSALHALVEKTLITLANGKVYQLTAAGHDLCEVCVKYDLMVETHYRSSDILSREIARQSRASEVIEGEFTEIHKATAAVSSPAVATEALAREPPPPPAAPPAPPPPPVKPVSHATPKPIMRQPLRPVILPPRIYSSLRRK